MQQQHKLALHPLPPLQLLLRRPLLPPSTHQLLLPLALKQQPQPLPLKQPLLLLLMRQLPLPHERPLQPKQLPLPLLLKQPRLLPSTHPLLLPLAPLPLPRPPRPPLPLKPPPRPPPPPLPPKLPPRLLSTHQRQLPLVPLPLPLQIIGRALWSRANPALLAISPDPERPIYEPSKRRLTWPNGAVATTYSADEPERRAVRSTRRHGATSSAPGAIPRPGTC